jgi:hypothetical protein
MVVKVPAPITGDGPPFITQIPVAGRPLNTTEPVLMAQVGGVIVPTMGAVGVPGAASICTLSEGAEVHDPLDTVNV